MQVFTTLRKLRRHELAKDASWLFLGRGLNFFIQAAFFVLLARVLGATQYGIFAGAYALVNTVTPYGALGSGILFMRYVTEDRECAPVYWGNALITVSVITTLMGILFVSIGPSITNVQSRMLIFYLVIANVFFSQITQVASRIYQTYQRMRASASVLVVTNFSRLVILFGMWAVIRHATAVQWALAIMVASGISAAVAFVGVRTVVPKLSFRPRLILTRFWEGISFSFTASTQAVYNDVDKTLLSHYRLNFENGFYTLAYRVIDFAATPIVSIDIATLPRYFQLYPRGLRPVLRLALKSIASGIVLSIFLGAAVWLIAPVVPYIAGPDFAGAVTALHWLCIIPMFRAIHLISGSALTATERQWVRLGLQFSVAVFNLGMNIYLIPRHGWIAAVWTSIASDGLLAALNSGVVLWLWRTAPRQEKHSELTSV